AAAGARPADGREGAGDPAHRRAGADVGPRPADRPHGDRRDRGAEQPLRGRGRRPPRARRARSGGERAARVVALVGRETVAAIATATGAGGIGVVRVSGPAALAIGAAVTGVEPSALEDRVARRVIVRGAAGARLDDGLALAMRGPRSFTGED